MQKKLIVPQLFILFLVSLSQALPAPLTQEQIFALDIDDNSFYTDAKIYVYDKKQGKEIAFSTEDWSLYRDMIGKEEPYKNCELRDDGLREFRDTPELGGENVFLNQVKKMVANKKPNEWQARSFKALQEACKTKEGAAKLYFITARGHSWNGLRKGFLYLQQMGFIKEVPPLENFIAVLGPDFPKEMIGKNSSESKANALMKILDKENAVPLPKDATPVTVRNGGKERKPLHLAGFSDDDYVNYKTMMDLLSPEVAKGRWKNIKISLFWTGRNRPELREKIPRGVVLKDDGTTRDAQPEEATRVSIPKMNECKGFEKVAG